MRKTVIMNTETLRKYADGFLKNRCKLCEREFKTFGELMEHLSHEEQVTTWIRISNSSF